MTSGWRSLIAVGSLCLVTCSILFGADYGVRYYNFVMLTKSAVVENAQSYTKTYFREDVIACLYVVECSAEHAQLVLIDDLDFWGLAETKQIIWKRRFSDFCSGRTTNIGLQIVPVEHGSKLTDSASLARWSFFNNRFVPQLSRFQSGAFSDRPWPECKPSSNILKERLSGRRAPQDTIRRTKAGDYGKGSEDMINMLIEAGADIAAKDTQDNGIAWYLARNENLAEGPRTRLKALLTVGEGPSE